MTGSRKPVSGIILSNSCDIDAANVKAFPRNILFAPIIKLGKYVENLRADGKTQDQIDGILTTIRKQRVTNIFYLPPCPNVTEEGFISMDDIYAHPLLDFLARDRKPLFKLNQFFFYFFIIKLSIHFCRFQEEIHRFASAVEIPSPLQAGTSRWIRV